MGTRGPARTPTVKLAELGSHRAKTRAATEPKPATTKPKTTLRLTPEERRADKSRRKFTIAELRRICSFPDDFQFVGPYAKQWERMGMSVPPVMMSHVAKTVYDQILKDS
tara:strand:+ start:509 stop:838 length:330 start_codon:yes stop_codon:yes gene_type:complete